MRRRTEAASGSVLSVRLTSAERARVDAAARAAGQTTSAWVRATLLAASGRADATPPTPEVAASGAPRRRTRSEVMAALRAPSPYARPPDVPPPERGTAWSGEFVAGRRVTVEELAAHVARGRRRSA